LEPRSAAQARQSARRRRSALRRLVGVLGGAGEAPQLGGFLDAFDLAGAVGVEVGPAHEDELVVGDSAALAGALHRWERTAGPPLHSLCRREPWVPWTLEVLMAAATAAPAIRARKGDGSRLVMVTAYDAPSARIVDDAGTDIILVGDSVAMVVLGYDDTLSVTVEDMAHHTAAVARARPRAMVVADMPWMSYHVSKEETVRNAATLLRAGASAVKLEGGRKRLEAIGAILDAEIP